MSIIIQVGHQSSYSKLLIQSLYERGLNEPLNSFTHQLTYQQVVTTIEKILSRDINSTTNSKLVDNIMVDFLLANLDSENWGWESASNLKALDYWQQLEPDVRFILVFDHPRHIFKLIDTEKMTTKALNQLMDEWIDYHKGILECLEKYENKSILVEGLGALQNLANLNKQVKVIANSLELKSSWQISDIPSPSFTTEDNINIVEEILVEEILCKYPEVINIFNTLISKATIKNSQNIYKTKRPDLDRLVTSINYFRTQSSSNLQDLENYNLLDELAYVKEEKKQLLDSLDIQKKENKLESNHFRLQLQETNDLLQRTNRELDSLKALLENKKSNNTEKNTQPLMEHLLDAQEEIEKLYTQNSKVYNLQKENQALMEHLLDAQEEIEKLHTQKSKVHNLQKENQALMNQLLDTQGKIEEIYENLVLDVTDSIENSSLNKSKQYKEIEKQYGAAEQIKSDLPYRLGQKIVKSKKPKDIVALPLVLAKEYRDFQLQALEKGSLPEIVEYLDEDEAEKVKEHLSYKLGVALVEGMQSPKAIVTLPKKLSKEILDFQKKKII